jgi:hypothetical protein
MAWWLEDQIQRRQISPTIYVLLLIAGLLALFATIISVSNYTRSVKAFERLAFEFTEIQVAGGDDPTAELGFRFLNQSSMPIWLESYEFSLYADGERIGSSSSTYRGAGANDGEHLSDRSVRRELAAGESLDLEFTLHIYPPQMETITRARQDGALTWSVTAGFLIRLPTAQAIESVGFAATREEM